MGQVRPRTTKGRDYPFQHNRQHGLARLLTLNTSLSRLVIFICFVKRLFRRAGRRKYREGRDRRIQCPGAERCGYCVTHTSLVTKLHGFRQQQCPGAERCGYCVTHTSLVTKLHGFRQQQCPGAERCGYCVTHTLLVTKLHGFRQQQCPGAERCGYCVTHTSLVTKLHGFRQQQCPGAERCGSVRDNYSPSTVRCGSYLVA
ncbi:hypothetical protein RRG08_044219 [Elysia crispata]|uniref:Uncharacterized protein n=1 Tax=Elysia crispata TaxID=231223 RepID=A0AAE0XXP0_9GAST|nr:hypothetical protein RRG08_044219 [Elysia crispata]